jgi:purine-binding chemotaxis protein CheW
VLNRLNQADKDLDTLLGSIRSIELLTFVFNEVIFALDILQVEEIHSAENLNVHMDMNNSNQPVISVRGKKVEIIDFGVKFGLVSKSKKTARNIIILNHHEKKFGIVIDGVAEVISTNRSLLSMPKHSLDLFHWLSYTSGLIKIDENILVVLDVEKLITHHEMRLDEGRQDE